MFARELPTFSIFDHLNKLQIVRQTRTAIRAICPICGGNNFEITTSGKTAGRYACYSNIGCTSEQIREAIAPLLQGNAPGSEAFEKAGSHYRGLGRRINLRVLPAPLKLYKPVLLPAGEIVLSTLSEDVDVVPIIQKGLNTEIIYHYSCEQWVLRTDFYNEAGERTHKTTKPWHINADSKNINSKGEKPWPIYRIHEAEQSAVDQWVLGVEGEKSVEAARFLGICTVTWMGSAWSDVDLESGLISLKKAGVAGLISTTLELTPHCPAHRLTWCLPYQYSAIPTERFAIATCPPIEAWFNSQVQDQGTIDVLRAYLYAVASGKSEWQQYLEIIGKGGTGKGTYTRLAQALVGLRNTHSTKLQKLEKSNFESASLKGKRLCVITDSERFAGEVSILKAMTGSDLIPYEVKGKQSTSGFIYPGMIIIAGNEAICLQQRFAIASSDYTSGTERRRIGVRFDQQVERKDQQILLDFRTNGEMFGEFAGYIPGLLNWVLSMGEVRAKELLKNHCEASQLLCQQKATMLTETNPLAAWADEELVQETGYRNYVGIAQQIRFTTGDIGQSESWTAYRNANTWLYPNYCQYAQNTGTNPLSQKRFTSLLLDLLQAQLKLPISKGTDRKGSYFEGIKIRTGSDDDISTLITKLSELEPNNSNFNTESEKCDRSCDGLMMGDVMVETLIEQACDGCDGKIDNYSIENENIKNTLSMNTGTALQGNLAFDPSQPITQVVIEMPKTTAVIEVEATVMGESVPSQLQELQRSGEVANTETEKAEEFLVLSELVLTCAERSRGSEVEVVEVINVEAVIAERNNKFPIGSYVYYKDSRFKGFGELGSKRLCQVIAHLDWCPEHIQVKGKGVEGIVACADCQSLTRHEELKLGLSRKIR
ncbi:DUF5906 domain-containing protein [Anabaena sp. AL93]|uniref:DUF5906 domain-containing protein n=1 Tax=Anabaena sp. AL93 TaxID=1678133 RepID=UPI000B26B874|nr:DUF5906 domain-containing protein [Anabaena sp. AL93]